MHGRAVVVCILFFPCCLGASAQTVPQRDPQAVLLLQKSLSALSGSVQIQDVTLSGAVQSTAGSDRESGTAILEGTLSGQGRIDLDLPSGPRSEVRDLSPGNFAGSWSDPVGTWHPIAGHNLWTDPTWFFPAFLILRTLSNASYGISPPDMETLNGTSVEHIAVFQAYGGSQQPTASLGGLGKIDIYLNAQSLVPAAIEFNVHPDDDAQVNIPVRVEYSNYQPSEGAVVAYRIRKYLQDGLVLDISLSSVQINTGLSSSTFQAQ